MVLSFCSILLIFLLLLFINLLYNLTYSCLTVDEKKHSFGVRLKQITLIKMSTECGEIKASVCKSKKKQNGSIVHVKVHKKPVTWGSERPVCKYIIFFFTFRSSSLKRLWDSVLGILCIVRLCLKFSTNTSLLSNYTRFLMTIFFLFYCRVWIH